MIRVDACEDAFGCQWCSGMGYEDYPGSSVPCRVPGHEARALRNADLARQQMEALRRDWLPIDGQCPYCRQTGNCQHWTGLGWLRDRVGPVLRFGSPGASQ